MNGFDDPVCDSFEAKIRNDQLCYEVDLDKYRDEDRIKEQLESGFVLILDCNSERQSETYNPRSDLKLGSYENDGNDVHIYLNTISKFHQVKYNIYNKHFSVLRSNDFIWRRRI